MFAKPRLLTHKQLELVVKYPPLDLVNLDYLVSDLEAERWLVNLQYISYLPFLYSGLHFFLLYVLVKPPFGDRGAILADPVVIMSEAMGSVLSCVDWSAMKPCSCSKYALTFGGSYFCLICESIIEWRNGSQSLPRSVCAFSLRFFASGGVSASELYSVGNRYVTKRSVEDLGPAAMLLGQRLFSVLGRLRACMGKGVQIVDVVSKIRK